MDVDAALANVAKETPGIVSVYLFGSVAEGRDHRESDVDVGVLLDRSVYPSERERFHRRLLLISDLSDAVRREADVIILNDAPPELVGAIVRRGRLIFCSNVEADRDFAAMAQILAADIAPWLQKMRAIKVKALLRQ